MRNKRYVYLIVALVTIGLTFAMLSLTACGDDDDGAGAGDFTGDDLVIGVLNSITGSNALTGAEQKWAQEKAAADINAAGGITLADGLTHQVVLKFYDDKSSDTEAAAAMEKAIKTDGLQIFLSSNTTPYNQAAATVAEQYQVYYHINTSWTDEASPDGSFPGFIGGMDLEWATDIFESAGDSGLAALGSIEALTEPIENVAVMTENNPDGVGFGDATAGGLEAAGYNVVAYEKFVEGQKDWSSIILKFKEANVEGIVCLISPADGITFVRQMKEQGWNPKFLFGYKGFWPVEFMKTLGSDSDYICFDGFWTESYPYPYAKELGQAFQDTHDGNTSVSIGLSYASAQILFTAIERAGVFEAGPVRDEVVGGSFPGTTMGDITYNEEGIADIPFLGFQWIDGERVVLHPKEFSTGDAQVFKAWDER